MKMTRFNFETPSYINGYHEYRKIWTPFLQEELCGEMEPANPVDKYAVAVKENNVAVGHLPLGCGGKFAKTIFYFLRADEWSEFKVIVTGKPVNRGYGDGMQVPCLLKFHEQKSLIGILKQQLDVMKQRLLLIYYVCILVLLYYRKPENNEVIPTFFPLIKPPIRCFKVRDLQFSGKEKSFFLDH